MDEATMLDSVVQSSKVSIFSMFSMAYKAPRRYSQGRNFGVERQQDFSADILSRRPYVPYDNGMKKGPNKLSRNLVWTSKEYKAPEGNRPGKNETNGSTKPAVLGTGYCVSNQPRKNAACGPRSSPILDTRGWGSRDNSSPKKTVCKYWKAGNCKRGEQCQFLHSWSCFPGLAMVAALEGHKKVRFQYMFV